MMLFTIAYRNILRNKRRSAATALAIAVGAVALLVFGGFQSYVFSAFQTNTVQQGGHLTIFRRGYFLFGSGNPTAYGIDSYNSVIALVAHDPILGPRLNVVTPSLALAGIAGNFEGGTNAAKTFLGVGIVPSDRERMRQWNEYGTGTAYMPDAGLSDNDPARGVVGVGLARVLGLCASLAVPNCPAPPVAAAAPGAGPALSANVRDLVRKNVASHSPATRTTPRIDLLAATAAGAPNVVTFAVSGAEPQSVKELDDSYIGMTLQLAQQLLYGRGTPKVTGIVLQLHRSEDLSLTRTRLNQLFAERGLPLEVRDFTELNPFYTQALNLFRSIFLFIAIIMGVIVLFAVVNTMTMTVMERTSEIGTARAMGVRRSTIRRQFLAEGAMLGALGATVGLVIAAAIALVVAHAGLTWFPPGNTSPSPLRIDLFGRWSFIAGVWMLLVLVATLAALAPANRAAKLEVVDALRYV